MWSSSTTNPSPYHNILYQKYQNSFESKHRTDAFDSTRRIIPFVGRENVKKEKSQVSVSLFSLLGHLGGWLKARY